MLLPERAAEPVLLNETGSALWGVLSEPATAAEISEALAPEYGTTSESLAADIGDFIDQLAAMGAIERMRERDARVGGSR